MNRLPLLVLIGLSSACSIAAQTDAGLSKVTLYWFAPSQQIDSQKLDASKSSVNFETGKPGEPGSQYDLRYGGMVIGTPHKQGEASKILADWLSVLDCRSKIVDLGVKQWADFEETPPFPRPKTVERPQPLNRPTCSVDVSAGQTDFSPYRQFVEVTSNHIYLVRLLRGTKAIYVMVRVESFSPRDNCVLSWKLVRPPNADDNEKI